MNTQNEVPVVGILILLVLIAFACILGVLVGKFL